MRGHWRKRGKKWYLVVDLPRGLNGKRKQKWVPLAETKRESETMGIKILRDLDTGAYIAPNKNTVKEFLLWWLENCVKVRNETDTYIYRKIIVNNYLIPRLGHYALSQLQKPIIQEFINELLETDLMNRNGKLSRRYIENIHAVLRTALNEAVDSTIIPRNPAVRIHMPRDKEKRQQTFLNEKQMKEHRIVVKDTQFEIPVELALATGMRRGEVLGLTWDCVDYLSRALTVDKELTGSPSKGGLRFKEPKTKKSKRTIIAPKYLIELLQYGACQRF